MNQTIRSLFPVTDKYIYMNHSAVCPLSTRVRDAMIGLVDDVAQNGAVNLKGWVQKYEDTRASAARLVNARTHEIAFMRNTSEAISSIANGIDWRVGDNVVTCNVEFPANVYPWMRLCEERGIEMKLSEERNGRIDAGELLAKIDDRTRVVTISWVQFASGFRSDLARIGRFCRERGVIFVVDVIQGLGGLKLDVERDCVDAFAADAHKYLLGPEGIALLYISDRVIDRIKPTVVGWTSVKNYEQHLDYDLTYREGAGRFECGTLNTAGVYGLSAAIDLFLEMGPSEIEAYLVGLSGYLAEGLASKGFKIISSRVPGEASAVVTCTHEQHSPRELYRLLRSRNIITAPRANRLRISPHFYNTREEVDTLIEALPD
ncbi:MAG TPA: aminotransferase class V-fold PLP-dependent enzyme [Blastocatellia bacterium]|nr:aminotransferase class V-fold PLP-dependent enzyme [Blastocatellia bacterium]